MSVVLRNIDIFISQIQPMELKPMQPTIVQKPVTMKLSTRLPSACLLAVFAALTALCGRVVPDVWVINSDSEEDSKEQSERDLANLRVVSSTAELNCWVTGLWHSPPGQGGRHEWAKKIY